MANKFVVADLHLGHKGVTHFLAPNGKDKLRPWDNPDDMDQALIVLWNSTVRPDDEVYVLGDVVLNRKHLQKLRFLHGRKHLVAGNHDVCDTTEYLDYFYRVSACRDLRDMILTHIPVHPSQLERFHFNVHGHLHAHKVMTTDPRRTSQEMEDPRYMCVSLEQTEFKPMPLDIVREELARRKADWPNYFRA